MHCRKIIFSILLLLASGAVAQNQSEEPLGDAKEYSGKQSQDWEKIQTKLGTMKSKLDTQENVIKNLIAEKSALSGEAQAVKMEQLKLEHNKFEAMVNEYNKLNLEYQTKFPERGIKEKRIYNRMKSKSLQSFEDDQTIQGRVNKLNSKIISQYPKSVMETKKKKLKKSEAAQEAAQEVELKKEKDVTDQIILKN